VRLALANVINSESIEGTRVMLIATESWKSTYPGACIGVLALQGAKNPEQSPVLEAQKFSLEQLLRESFAGMDRATLKAHPTLAAYAAYYKAFKKTYHVQLQLESIVFKGKSIPKVAALVEAMFMAELKNLLLTAGHDLDTIQGAPTVNVATGDETYIKLNGQEQVLKAGDMYIHDTEGVLSSIIYGPAQRTSITAGTTHALFTTYGPPGISSEQMGLHLEDIKDYSMLISPDLRVESLEVISAV
jgi:DNA/RNA-binding domain of Phe-tRNA-synthetase-like protein